MKISAFRSIARPRVPVPVMHSEEEVSHILGMLKDEQPGMIIELGTCYGGLTMAMNLTLPSALIYSFDREYKVGSETLRSLSGNVAICIVPELTTQPLHVILELLGKTKTFLYSDNGDKVKEVEMYLPYLSKGDILGVHDFVGATADRIAPLVNGLEFFAPISSSVSCRLWRV